MILLKIGGSVVTDKSKPLSIREDVIKRLAYEIKSSKKDILIVHGGGSFGHPIAIRHRLQEGLKEPGQLKGIAETRAAMGKLNQRIVEILVDTGLHAVSFQTSALFICENKRIATAHLDSLRGFLQKGIIPVLYGDVVIDKSIGVSILSGDQIVTYLAKYLHPEKVVLGTDVDGLLDENGNLIEVVTSENASQVLSLATTREGDVTGGMRGKVEELMSLSDEGISSIIINALEKDLVGNSLLGKKTDGTVFEAADDRGKKA